MRTLFGLTLSWILFLPLLFSEAQQAHVEPRTITVPVVDGKGVRFTRLSTDDGLSQTRVSQIVQDDQGFMWFGSQYGLNRYDGYTFKVFKHEPGRTSSLSGVFIYSLFKDRTGTLWVGCDEFLDKFDPVTETFTHYRIDTTGAQGETVPVTNISQDHTGRLWLSTSRGLYRFDPSTGRVIRYRHDPNNPFSLSSDEIRTTGEDREGTFWVSTSEGLDAFDRDTEKVTLHVPLQNLSGTSFYEDRFGAFWIFQITGGGLAVFDRKTNTLTHYSFHEGHLSDALQTGVMTMLEDREGNLWFGTFGDGLIKFDRQERKFIRYRNDPANPDSLGQNDVATLFQDREGNIWAGLHMMAPNRFSTRPPLFEKFKHESGNPNSLSGTMVNGIYEDREGILWISSINALNRVDRKTGHYNFYQTAGPGVSPRPTAIVEDRSGFLWIGSDNHGLARFDPKTGLSRRFRHSPTGQFSLSSDYVTHLLIDQAGTAVNGTMHLTTFAPWVPEVSPDPEATKSFIAEWKKRGFQFAGVTESFRGYDGIRTIAAAIQKAGKAEPEAIRAALWQLDITGSVFLTDGTELKLISGIDDHSRFCVIATVVRRGTARAVCRANCTPSSTSESRPTSPNSFTVTAGRRSNTRTPWRGSRPTATALPSPPTRCGPRSS